MTRYSNNIFKYNNTNYTFFVDLYVNTGDKDNDLHIGLDMSCVEEFVYENKFNELCLKGHIIYTDRHAQVDKMLNQPFAYCQVLFAKNKENSDGQIVVEKLDNDYKFSHIFIISSISIFERQQNTIKYKINLISNNWFNCTSKIFYSNYDKEPEQIFDIIKNCFSKCDLKINDDSFGIVKTNVKLNYITHNNDNMFSIIKYLMHKLYYFNDKDDSMKFFMYNETDNMYQLFDVKNNKSSTGSYNTILSFFKTNNEALIQQEPTNMLPFRNPISKTELYQNLFKINTYNYDFETNSFNNVETQPDTTVNYLNNKFDNGNYEKKFTKMFDSTLKFEKYGSFWNNDFDQYGNSFNVLMENNSLILDITGEILRKPGSYLLVSLDRSMKNLDTERKDEFEKLKKKYKAYEGIWMISKVQHIIRPARQQYRQNVVLFRNYISKIEEK